MKKHILFLIILLNLFFLFSSQKANSQIPEFKCGTMEYLEQQKKSDTSLESNMLLHEQQIQKWIKEKDDPKSLSVITIPIVFHIVYFNDAQNLTDSMVFEQIEITNRDYAGLNNNSMGAFPDSLKANTGIQFCLAQRKPDGSPTNGIERRLTTDSMFLNNNVKYYKSGGLDAWDPNKYLNIWICNTQGLLCWGQFPVSGINETYGAVVDYQGFGPKAVPPWDKGSLTSHEIGHCLYLYHIWADDNGACTGTDYCNDTPNQANYAYGNPKGIVTDSCTNESPGIMYMNFMDYTTSYTTANFTPGQTARMRAMFVPPYGYLVSLANSDACSPPTYYEESIATTTTVFSIFPNPAYDFITITLSNKGLQPYVTNDKVQIFDMLGLEVHTTQTGMSELLNIDVSHLPAGVYFIRIGTRVEKFVKM